MFGRITGPRPRIGDGRAFLEEAAQARLLADDALGTTLEEQFDHRADGDGIGGDRVVDSRHKRAK
jgi:hypothetical protein